MPEASKPIRIAVLCIFQEMGASYVQCVGQNAIVAGHQIRFNILAGDPRVNPAWQEEIKKADALVMLVRFMDVISMDKIKAIYRSLPTDKPMPMSFVVFREEGESDFKMSCSACGQKLWVRDEDVGKRGRCPNCRRAFRLPLQKEYLKEQLVVPDAVEVIRANPTDHDACCSAISALLDQMSAGRKSSASVEEPEAYDPNVLKQSTMRIQLSSSDTTTDESTDA